MKLLIIFLLLGPATVKATTLECKSFINLDEVSSSIVVPILKNKILINKSSQITSYVTELKPSFFSVEAFIPNLQVRIYSEAAISNLDETITATVWAQDILVDVVCKKIK